jgi:surface protein
MEALANFVVDWGDGTSQTITSSTTHTYPSPGIYTVTCSGDLYGFYFFNNTKIVDILNWGDFRLTMTYASLPQVFGGCTNLNISALDAPIITTTTMLSIFDRCSSLTTADFSKWDVSTVTSLRGAFCRATNFNGNLSGWNVSNVENFGVSQNFAGTFELSGFNGDLSSWSIKAGASMIKMFSQSQFKNASANNWAISGAVNLRLAFRLIPLVNDVDISGWNVSQAIDLYGIFNGTKLTTANYDKLLIAWDAQGAMTYSGTVDFGTSKYTAGGAAQAARTSLITKWGGITDGGPA